MIEVQDHCGGLGAGDAEKMFLPFTQAGVNKTGLGLGLAISRRSVEVWQLGVAHLLEGSVQKSGDAVRVNVQLIKRG